MREQAKTVRQPRTVFGGRLNDGRPLVTWTIIGLCVAAYLAQRSVPGFTGDFAFASFLAVQEPWRFLTAAFLHAPGQLLHIGLNMYALWLLGPYLESQLGRARFAALYLLSALGGSVGYLLLADPLGDSWRQGVVGASGAVFGLFGALVIVQRRLGRRLGHIAGILAINTVVGFVWPGIAWQAHLGGLVVGGALAAALVYAPKSRRTFLQVVGVLLVLAAMVVATTVKLALVP